MLMINQKKTLHRVKIIEISGGDIMVLKGYVKRVAELKKKTKEQLINYIIERERKRDDKLSHFVGRTTYLTDSLENSRKENVELEKEISKLRTQLEMIEKVNSRLIGEIKFKENDLYKAQEIISNHSERIGNVVLNKFNELKTQIIQELVNDKISIIKKELVMQKEKDLIEIFEFLGISKEKLMEIIKK